ncbi:hypothetical protein [Streptomyces boninensis]|uniref:hypothetical protein n=1 Tax=Streptomyces boninensis TaxID=2039455 RepID=UPI003B21352C
MNDEPCTLTATLRHSRGALSRITAVLTSHGVLALRYSLTDAGHATAEVRLPGAHAVRARAKLLRMVDVVDVS